MATRPHQPPHGHRSTDDGFLPARPGPAHLQRVAPPLSRTSQKPPQAIASWPHKGKPLLPLPVPLPARPPPPPRRVLERLPSLPSPAMASAGGSSGVVGKPRLLSHPLRFALNISPTCRRRRLVSDRTPIGSGCGGRSDPVELATGSLYSVRRADLFVISAVAAACSPKSQIFSFQRVQLNPQSTSPSPSARRARRF